MKNIIFTLLILFVAMPAWSMDPSRAVNAIIGEAEGESYIGKLAVACAIRNRGTLKGVYGEKAPRVTKQLYSAKVKADAQKAWKESEGQQSCQFIDGADHWEGTKFKTPSWAKDMKITATIGGQRFYRRMCKKSCY